LIKPISRTAEKTLPRANSFGAGGHLAKKKRLSRAEKALF
jgi:hypothetical protein